MEIAAGKLISAIQKVWNERLGEPEAKEGEEVMNRSHELLQAAKRGELVDLLGQRSVAQFLGEEWTRANPGVMGAVAELQQVADGTNPND
jgi:hypothetical protein